MVESEVPRLPQRVLVGRREGRVRLRGALVRPHHPLCQEKVPEETGHQEVLSVQLLELICVCGCGIVVTDVCLLVFALMWPESKLQILTTTHHFPKQQLTKQRERERERGGGATYPWGECSRQWCQ